MDISLIILIEAEAMLTIMLIFQGFYKRELENAFKRYAYKTG